MKKKVIIKGKVQGVGCRGYCAKIAKKYFIHGSATNISDGSVRLLLEIEDEQLFKQYLNSVLNNEEGLLFYGRIDDISVSDYSGKINGDYIF